MDVDFYTLERPVQDRFADATRAIGLPAPIVREPPGDRQAVFWWAAASGVAVGLAALVARGVGSLESPVALAPPAYAAVYTGLAAVVAFCALRALSLRNARVSLPYEPGLYLFPAGVFDARAEPLRVYRHSDFRGITISGAVLRVSVNGGEFVFRLPDAAAAEAARTALEEAGHKYEAAVRAASRREQAALDPLVDSGFSSPFSPQFRLSRSVPLWTRLTPLLALVVGAALGPVLWKARNVVSERRLYATARAIDQVSAYRAYVDRGGPRSDVSDILLPRAELKVAVARGTVEALESFVRSHPASKIQVEVDAALRAAVGAELAAARSTGTVSALREFREKRGGYAFILPSVEAATVEVYRRVLSALLPGKDPAVASLYERLLGYAKQHGAHGTVRFVRRLPESVELADSNVRRSAYFMGKESVPSQYFKGEYAERREADLGARLAALMNGPFPADVLRFELGPAVTDVAAPPPLTEPTLTVDYAPEMAGGYMSPKPRGVFVGVGMMVKASLQIPGDTQPLEYKFSMWRTPNPQILKNDGAKVSDVYDKMATDCLEKFLKGFSVLLTGKE